MEALDAVRALGQAQLVEGLEDLTRRAIEERKYALALAVTEWARVVRSADRPANRESLSGLSAGIPGATPVDRWASGSQQLCEQMFEGMGSGHAVSATFSEASLNAGLSLVCFDVVPKEHRLPRGHRSVELLDRITWTTTLAGWNRLMALESWADCEGRLLKAFDAMEKNWSGLGPLLEAEGVVSATLEIGPCGSALDPAFRALELSGGAEISVSLESGGVQRLYCRQNASILMIAPWRPLDAFGEEEALEEPSPGVRILESLDTKDPGVSRDQASGVWFKAVNIAGKPMEIGLTEVTTRQWRRFVQESGYVSDSERLGGCESGHHGPYRVRGLDWRSIRSGPGSDDLHVTMISARDARAFCDYHGFRLPTLGEFQEMLAAYGEPETGQSNLCGYPSQADVRIGVCRVGAFRPDANGLHDLLGNVEEWVTSAPDADVLSDVLGYRQLGDVESGAHPYMCAGGSFGHARELEGDVRARIVDPDVCYGSCGFRVVRR